jgi:multicomponent Na+:H+ antiporter subunit A
MKMDAVWKLLAASVIILFGVILISTTKLSYPLSLNLNSEFYLKNLHLTGSINAVNAILLDFRVYDTLGEILVIFVTISGITMLIGRKK